MNEKADNQDSTITRYGCDYNIFSPNVEIHFSFKSMTFFMIKKNHVFWQCPNSQFPLHGVFKKYITYTF